MSLPDIEHVVRELGAKDPNRYPVAEDVAVQLGMNVRTVSRAIHDAGFPDFRTWTRQLLKL